MKKLLILATMVLGVVSCMKDQSFEAGNGGESKVVLSVALPEGATRAAGADSALGAIDNIIDLATKYDIRYVLAVYDDAGNLAKDQIVKIEKEATSTQFELRLVPGRDYRFVVWADFVAEGTTESLHYNTADLKNVTLKDGSLQLPMDESRDAYTAVKEIEKFNSASEVKLTLTRPFAKLRVVTNDMDQIYSKLTKATVEYTTEVYTVFNALTAEAGEAETITEKVALLDNDAYQYANENGTAKMTLFADYLFGTVDGTVKFSMDIEDATGYPIPTIEFNTNIPVERNHLTTIYGPILTDFNQVTVTIDERFDGYNNVNFKPEDKAAIKALLNEAVAAGETNIVIDAYGANIGDLNYGLTKAMVPAGTTVTIRNAVVEGRSYGNGVDGTVIFEGCTFYNSGAYSIHFDNGAGKVIFKDCKLYGWNSFGATLESVSFERCSLEGNGTYALIRSYADLTLTDCTINTKEANHSDNYNEGVEAISPATLTENNVTYFVWKSETLADAVSVAGETVSLAAGEYTFPSSIAEGVTIVCQEGVVFTGKSGLNINGATVVGATFSNPTGNAVAGTINGAFENCTFTGSNALRNCYVGETCVFENCVFSGNTYGVHFDGGTDKVVTLRNCTLSGFNAFAAAIGMVNFEGCTFVGNGKSGYNGANLWGNATLKNCEFTFNGTTANEWVDCIGANKTYSFENCTINGVAYTSDNYTSYGDIFSRNNTTVKINGVDCAM